MMVCGLVFFTWFYFKKGVVIYFRLPLLLMANPGLHYVFTTKPYHMTCIYGKVCQFLKHGHTILKPANHSTRDQWLNVPSKGQSNYGKVAR